MKKKSEPVRHVACVIFTTLLLLSAAVPAMAGGIREKQGVELACDTGYMTTETGDDSQLPVRQCLSENTQAVSVPAGTRFSVHFPDNPTTGMTWGLMHMPSSVMLLSAEHTVPASCHTGMTGCGGEFMSTFKAISHGAGNIIFTHSRLWENTYPAVKTLRINIQ